MAGDRGRCFYCSDSRGADVEHYDPLSRDHKKAFLWRNLLWICPECNRRKVARFPLAEDGTPLILDPTEVDPWEILALDASSGFLAPRFLADGSVDARGEATLEVLETLNFETVVTGRARAIRRLREALRRSLLAGDTPEARRDVLHALEDDDFGVVMWFVRHEGRHEPPFVNVSQQLPALWRRLCVAATAKEHAR
jgi:hypothetical protein